MVTIPTLVYTATNLPGGGLFDIGPAPDCGGCQFRNTPHKSHRTGRDADLRIRNIPAGLMRLNLIAAIAEMKLTMPVLNESPANPNATHWHLRY